MMKQKGSVLIVSMVLLFLLTLVGVTSMSTTSLEEKMAGNLRNQQLAFQAAEAALREGERFVLNTTGLSGTVDDNCTNGLCTRRENDANYVSSAGCVKATDGSYVADSGWVNPRWLENGCDTSWDVWSNSAKYRQYVFKFAESFDKPKYIIEFLNQLDCPGSAVGSNDCELYRVTAVASGGSSDSSVTLQSTFRKQI